MLINKEDVWRYTKNILTKRGITINSEVDKLAQKYVNNELTLKELKRLIEKGFDIYEK